MKEVGDFAQEDEVIAIVETDKVSVDIRAPVSGVVTNIMADIDAVVEVVALAHLDSAWISGIIFVILHPWF